MHTPSRAAGVVSGTTDRTGTTGERVRAPRGDGGISRQERSVRTARLLRQAASCPDEEERTALLEAVITLNLGVAESVAARYRNRGVALDDLLQVAYLGLTRAVHGYELGRADDLLTYAVPTIRGELQRHFRDHGWSVRPTRRVQELQYQVNRTIEELSQRLGREPSEQEICSALDLGHQEYAEAVTAFGCFQPASLDRPATSDSSTTVGELVGEEQSVGAAEARTILRPVLRQLSERDRRILYLRFFEDRTQDEIGRDLGVTQMQVSRLLKRILSTLRDRLE